MAGQKQVGNWPNRTKTVKTTTGKKAGGRSNVSQARTKNPTRARSGWGKGSKV